MSTCVSNNLHLSSTLNMDEEALLTKKQGIVSILGSDSQRSSTKAASLRRTLSADMSSKKWLTQHGFSPMKKIASSEEFAVSMADSSSEDEYEDCKDDETGERFHFWASIQEEKNGEKELEKPAEQFNIWSSILTQTAQADPTKPLPPPYVHPLVKRSASSLNEKSLEICTESLGSETGSDGFSSYPPSETDEMEEDKEEQDQQEPQHQSCFDVDTEPRIIKYNYLVGKKLPQRSFPPPIPSLSCQDGASLRMRTHRDNGRLVLEAVSVPSKNNFRAQRQDGRLILTFAAADISNEEEPKNDEMYEKQVENELEELDEEFGSTEEEKESEIDGEETEEGEADEEFKSGNNEMGFAMEQAPKLSSGFVNVHGLALMMNKPMLLANRTPTWPKRFNEIVKLGEEDDDEEEVQKVEAATTPLAQSLPPRPRVTRLIPTPPTAVAAVTATAASFNAYEYYWKPKPMTKAGMFNPLAQHPPPLKNNNSSNKLILSKNPIAKEQQQLSVVRGSNNKDGDYLVPSLNGCKEPRRSLLFWEPYCIATS